MTTSFSARYLLTADDFVEFSKVYSVLTPFRRAMRAIFWLLAAAMLAAAFYFAVNGDRFLAIYWACIAVVLVALRAVLEPWIWRRSFVRQHIGEHEMTLTGGDEGFSLKSAVSSGKVAWVAIRRADILPDHIFLWPNDRIGYIVPKRGFATPEEADAFAKLAMEKTLGKTL